MIAGKKVLALIPARGGSKRLPRKNVAILAGKPLIAWTIEAANKSKYIDTVVVSTDDNEIAEVSECYGAQIPFRRPEELASDAATSNDVILHALQTLEEEFDLIVLLQPTSPLRNETHIDESLDVLLSKDGEGVISVAPCDHSPLWANILPETGDMKGFLRSYENVRSQDLEKFYRLNGAIYAFHVDSILDEKGISYSENVYSYIMPSEFSVDIDTELDFKIAEVLMDTSPLAG